MAASEVENLLEVLRTFASNPEVFLTEEELSEFEASKQSVVEARRSAERNEGQLVIA